MNTPSRCNAAALLVALSVVSCLAAPVFRSDQPEPLVEKGHKTPDPPVFPDQYEVKYTFSMPYTKALQYDGLSYDVHMWYDGPKGLMRFDTLDGLDSTLHTEKATFEVVPAISKMKCIAFRNSASQEDAPKGIPTNLTDWAYGGKTTAQGRKANLWVNMVKMFDRVEYYYYYIAIDGTPLYLSVMGQDWFSGSHFDQYIVKFDYDSWKPGPVSKNIFEVPDVCLNGAKTLEKSDMGNGAIRMQGLIPRIYRGDREYDLHSHEHGRKHSSPAEYHTRAELFAANKLIVNEHNSKVDRTYSLGLNRFADWTEAEFRATMLGRGGDTSIKDKLTAKAPVYSYQKHKHKHTHAKFPAELDWEGTLSDGVVRDQADCGSCWAFGAVGTMEGAWYRATGEKLFLSEQQVVDCSWDYGVQGCDGGFAESGIQYAADNGGMMTNVNYEYIGEDNWCRFNTTHEKKHASAFFTGFSTVAKDTDSIKSALFMNGPLAVALDASDPHFRFYTEGVYDSTSCDPNNLDHVVTLVGYGTEKGESFLKLRNSWSKYWGNEGYIRISEKNDCGVKSSAVFALVDKEKAAEARRVNS